MSKILSNFLFVCGEIWKSIGMAQRLSIIMLTLLGAVAVGVVVFLGTRPNWQILYSRLDEETASRVYELARDANVPVRLKDSGRTILVPFEHINDIRLKAAKAGVVKAEKGIGLELFDNVKIGMTEMQQNVGYQRAIQGEIQRMLRKMPGITDANVVLVLPPKRLYRHREETRSKASVMVVMEPDVMLEGRQVTAIRNLVAATVDGMKAEDVTVTDSAGRLLARGQGNDSGSGSGSADATLEAKERLEESLREKAEVILRPLAGDATVVAVVNTELDFSGGEKLTEQYENDRTVLVSEKVTTDDSNKGARRSEGPPGVASNIVSVRNPDAKTPAGDTSQQSRKTVENQYLVPKTVEKVTTHGPRIKALSVAVTLGRPAESKARTPEELDSLRQLVMSAVGAQTGATGGRNDTVTVVEQELPKATPLPALPPLAWTQRLQQHLEHLSTNTLVRPLIGAGLLLSLYLVFGMVFRRDHVERFELNGRSPGDDFTDVTAEAAPAPPGLPERHPPLELVKTKSESNPELVAGVMQSWVRASKL